MHIGGPIGPIRASASSTLPEAPSAAVSGARCCRFPCHPPTRARVGPELNVASASDGVHGTASSSAGARYGSYHTGLGPLAGLLGYHSRRHGAAAAAGGAAPAAAGAAASLTVSPFCSAPLTALAGLRTRAAARTAAPAPALSGAGSARGGPHPLPGSGPPRRLLLTRCHARRGGQGDDSDGEPSSSSLSSSAKIECSVCGKILRQNNLEGHFEKGCQLPVGTTEGERQQLIREHEKRLKRANGLDGSGGFDDAGMLSSRSARSRRTVSRTTMAMPRHDPGSASEGEGEAEQRGRGRGAAGATGPAPGTSGYSSGSRGAASGTGGGSSSDAIGGSGAAGATAGSKHGAGDGAGAHGGAAVSSSSTGAAEPADSTSSSDASDSTSGSAAPVAAGAKRSAVRSSPQRRTRPASDEGAGGAGTATLDRPRGHGGGGGAAPGDGGAGGSGAAAPAGSAPAGVAPPMTLQSDMTTSAAMANMQLPGDPAALAAAGLTQADGLLLAPSPRGSPPGSPAAAAATSTPRSRTDWLEPPAAIRGGAGAGTGAAAAAVAAAAAAAAPSPASSLAPAQPQAAEPAQAQAPEDDGPVAVLDPLAVAAEVAHVDNGLTGSRRAMAVAGVEASARRPAPAAAPAKSAGAAEAGPGQDAGAAAGGRPPDNEAVLKGLLKEAGGGLQGRTKKIYREPKYEIHKPPGFDPNDRYFTSLTPEALAWLRHTRRISDDVIRAAKVFVAKADGFIDKATGRKMERLALCFPYFVHGRMVNFKQRFFVPEWPQPFSKKDFRMGYKCELVAYGVDDLLRHVATRGGGPVSVVVVEGEMDKLALNTAGYWNVVSVPNGAAISKLNPADPEAPPQQQFSREPDKAAGAEAQYYSWLESLLRVLPDPAKAVFVLATDTDTAGRALRAELMRRLGRERCWEVTSWDNEFLVNALGQLGGEDPHAAAHSDGNGNGASAGSSAAVVHPGEHSNGNGATAAAAAGSVDTGRRKDANDVLVLDGPERLSRLLAEEARPAKLRGLATFREYEAALTSHFMREDPLALGVSTGWPSLDRYYRVAPGELTIVTGIPNSGKSEFLDALLVNLAENHGWAFAMCSLEKGPVPHLKALIEKRMRKPFRSTWHNGHLTPAMGLPELVAGFQWVADHFHLIRYDEADDTGSPTIDWVLNMARIAVMRYGIRGLLIDPYNELDSRRGRDVTETDHIKEMLTRVRKFARETDCHVWFVAHPRQQHAAKTGAKGGGAAGGASPGLYDISGSAHWFNKTDNGIVVHRRFEVKVDPVSGKEVRVALPEVEVKLQKVRNKDVGTQGQTHLLYDRPTGRYADCEAWPDKPPDAVERRSRDLGYVPAAAAAQPPAAAMQPGTAALPAASGGVVDTTATPVPPSPQQPHQQPHQQPYGPPAGPYPPRFVPPPPPPPPHRPAADYPRHGPAALPPPPPGLVGPKGTFTSAAATPHSFASASAPRASPRAATGTHRPAQSPAASARKPSGGSGKKAPKGVGTKEAQGRAIRSRLTQQPPDEDDELAALVAGAQAAERAAGITSSGGGGGGLGRTVGGFQRQEDLEYGDEEDEEGDEGGAGGKRGAKPRAPRRTQGRVQEETADGVFVDKREERLGGLAQTLAENEGVL
ncbi:hypothetical protein HXX76_000237 [Chlamydomonas incerta]|uniref:SF4 helicase domain-containing protein n=1 Tax=Chlamydomonas incerta TaxID=51695 RepID=A0A836B2H3_CHLIN|nr:hypothetical protein HXX76_000237 [Chlamydomonas incerta]|eukprot:KAG2445627.1 hypothetical protein HXX76_000237 [Chlamydomonas incerta]